MVKAATKKATAAKSSAPPKAKLADRELTDRYKNFAAYIEEQTGYKVSDPMTCQLSLALYSDFQKSDTNRNYRQELEAQREQREAEREQKRTEREAAKKAKEDEKARKAAEREAAKAEKAAAKKAAPAKAAAAPAKKAAKKAAKPAAKKATAAF